MLAYASSWAGSIFQKRTLPNKVKPDIMALVDFPHYLVRNLTWKNLTEIKLKTATGRVLLSLNVFLAFLLYPVLAKILWGNLGFIISYQVYYNYGALKAGQPAWGMLTWKGVHIHHWLYCAVGLVGCWILGLQHPFLVGLFFGGITHGLQFPDWSQGVNPFNPTLSKERGAVKN
jgi:nitrate reductase NapE component